MMTENELAKVLAFWEQNDYPNSIMESQRKYNAVAFEWSKKRVEAWKMEFSNGGH